MVLSIVGVDRAGWLKKLRRNTPFLAANIREAIVQASIELARKARANAAAYARII
jgi:hypothetical protein